MKPADKYTHQEHACIYRNYGYANFGWASEQFMEIGVVINILIAAR